MANFYAEVNCSALTPLTTTRQTQKASTQNFSRIATGRCKQGMHFKGLSCKVSSVLSSARKVELKPQPCSPCWLRPNAAV